VINLLKIIFGTAVGIELANYDMARGAARTLAKSRERFAQRLSEVAPGSPEANDLTHHMRRIDEELARFGYYGIRATSRSSAPQNSIMGGVDSLERHQRRVFLDRERRLDDLIRKEKLRRR
jgi:hypothetical protein